MRPWSRIRKRRRVRDEHQRYKHNRNEIGGTELARHDSGGAGVMERAQCRKIGGVDAQRERQIRCAAGQWIFNLWGSFDLLGSTPRPSFSRRPPPPTKFFSAGSWPLPITWRRGACVRARCRTRVRLEPAHLCRTGYEQRAAEQSVHLHQQRRKRHATWIERPQQLGAVLPQAAPVRRCKTPGQLGDRVLDDVSVVLPRTVAGNRG
jgi:hypothetical protein